MLRWVLGILAVAVLTTATAMVEAAPEPRVALVIGNATYQHVKPLANPTGDAKAMTQALQGLGFEVVSVLDGDRTRMVRALGEFRKKLSGDGVGLFYYAGHGMQVRGHNYLIPVDAEISDENDTALLAIDLETVQHEMEAAGVRLSLYILDACRDNPFEKRFRSAGSRGLAPIDAARGTVIAFATAPGKTAADGDGGGHGLFTGELLKAVVRPGLELEEVLKETAAGVERASKNQQTPWYNSAFHGRFYFTAPVTVNVTPGAPASEAPRQGPSEQKELAFWESIKSSKDPADFDDFLKRFPQSEFASLAERRRDALKKGAEIATATPPRAAPASPPTAPAVVAPPPAVPVIRAISAVLPQPDQSITIVGSGFGKLAPYIGNSRAIRISTSTGWNAGSTRDPGGDLVTLAVRSWSDTEIVLDGFRGAYGRNNWTIRPGDRLTFQIWNAESNAGPATFAVAVAPAPPTASPPQAGGEAQRGFRQVRRLNQPEARDATGRITTEAAIIHVVACDGPMGNGAQIYVYEYQNRPGFRAIHPPDWGNALGGRDFPHLIGAATAGCLAVSGRR